MISISVDNITLSFGVERILDSVSFALNDGEKLGIVGVNGAGKSSLFKVMTGEYQPDSGEVFLSKGHTLGILEQENCFDENNSVLFEALKAKEEIIKKEAELELLRIEIENGESEKSNYYTTEYEKFVSVGGLEYRKRVKGTLLNMGFAEEYWDKPVKLLSGGQKTRLALVRLILREPDVLLLDEPTNHLDISSVEWLEAFLKAYKKTVIVISHDRYFLDNVTNKILEIENRKSRLYNGNYSKFVEQKKNDREIQERHYKNQQREIAKIEQFIEQQRRWNREKNIIAAESRMKMLDRMEKIDKPENLPDSVRMTFSVAGESGNDVLSVNNLSKSFGNKILFSNVDFEIKKRQRVFVTGENGCGKSTLIKILAGKLAQDSGSANYGYNVKIGYYDQENQNLDGENTVLGEIWDRYPNLTQTEIRNALALFLFKGDDVLKKVNVLSGGEKARLTLCKLILSKMNFLILDEPTNHLDINSREALENALEHFDGTLICVSHDRYFILKLATDIYEFQNKGIFCFKGDYEQFKAYKKNSILSFNENFAKEKQSTQSKEDFIENKRIQSEIRKNERKLKNTKDEIERTENDIALLDEEIKEYETDYVKSAELWEKKEKKEEKLLELYELLEELEKQ